MTTRMMNNRTITLRLLFIFCLYFFVTANTAAQESRVFDNLSLPSKILQKEMKFAVYLPAGYDTSQRRYPVLYLLHGGGGNHTEWIQFGNMQAIVDASLRADKSDPMIIVMPDAEMTFYLNHMRGEYNYEDYFVKELIPHIEANYRCRKGKIFRSIAGLSMGGFGSLLYALHHPELFQSCYAMSAAVRTEEEINKMALPEFQRRYKTALGETKDGDARTNKEFWEFWRQNSILDLVKNLPDKQKNAVRLFLDCGDDDAGLYTGNSLLHILLRDRQIPHEYRVRNGGHTWEYWRTGLPEALSFISQGMR